jgi:anti-sigma B factor antagonist
MTHDELTIDIRTEHHGEAVVYTLRGSLDLATSPSVRAALVQAADRHLIVVDLRKLEFLDSTGLGALIGAHRRALEHDGSVRLVVNEGSIARLLNITGLMRVFPVYHTLEDALADEARLSGAL